MAKGKHLKMLRLCKKSHKHIKLWNDWRQKHPDVAPDLAGADLSGIVFSSWRLWIVLLPGRLKNYGVPKMQPHTIIGKEMHSFNFEVQHFLSSIEHISGCFREATA
jgi:hypothetical protein